MKNDTISEVKYEEEKHVVAYTAGGQLVRVPRAEIAEGEDIVGKEITIEPLREPPNWNIGHLVVDLM